MQCPTFRTGFKRRVWRGTVMLAGIAVVASLDAQPPPVPSRAIGDVIASAGMAFGIYVQVVPFADGRVLVNDGRNRRVVLLDAQLGAPVVVLDSTAGARNSYGRLGAQLIRFRGDSALFHEMTSNTFLVLDPRGAVARVMAPPFAGGRGFAYSMAYSDRLGLVYTVSTSFDRGRPAVVPGEPYPSSEDSITLATADLESRRVDTVGRIASGRVTRWGSTITTSYGPYPFPDAFAVTSDGSVAILHTREYRMEWLGTDRVRSTSPRLPFEWRRVADADRGRLLDSVNAPIREQNAAWLTKWIDDSTHGRLPQQQPGFGAGRGGGGGEPPPPPRLVRPAPHVFPLVLAREIPEFLPPMAARESPLADTENNVWVPRAYGAGVSDDVAVYDVVNRRGELVERVTVPGRRRVVALGSGFAILSRLDAGQLRLEKVRLR